MGFLYSLELGGHLMKQNSTWTSRQLAIADEETEARRVGGTYSGHTAGQWERWGRTSRSGSRPVLWHTGWAATTAERHGHAGCPGTAGWRKLVEKGQEVNRGQGRQRPSRRHEGCKRTPSPSQGKVGGSQALLTLLLRRSQCQAGSPGTPTRSDHRKT